MPTIPKSSFKPLPVQAGTSAGIGLPQGYETAVYLRAPAYDPYALQSLVSSGASGSEVSSDLVTVFGDRRNAGDFQPGAGQFTTYHSVAGTDLLVSTSLPLLPPGDEVRTNGQLAVIAGSASWFFSDGAANTVYDMRMVTYRQTYATQVAGWLNGGEETVLWIDANDGDDGVIAGAATIDFSGGSGFDHVDYRALGATDSLRIRAQAAPGQYTVEKIMRELPGWVAAAKALTISDDRGRVQVREFVPQIVKEKTGMDYLHGVELIRGGNGVDQMVGGINQDAFEGGGGNDLFFGAGGDDTWFGGPGTDGFDGGEGVDTADYSLLGGAINVTLGGASVRARDATSFSKGAITTYDTRVFKSSGGEDRLKNVEKLVGSAFGDNLAGDANSNYLDGGAGNDSLYGGAGADVLIGGAGNDRLAGGPGIDRYVFFQNNGEDRIYEAPGETMILEFHTPNANRITEVQDGLDMLIVVGTENTRVRLVDYFAANLHYSIQQFLG